MKLQSREDFNKWTHRFGILSSLVLFVGMTAFPVVASAVCGRTSERCGPALSL